MTHQNFDHFQHDLLDEVVAMKNTKGLEYSRDDDRFANFKRGAKKNKKLTPLDVLQIYLAKHLDAIDSYIETGKEKSTESIRGRIVDAITYLTLLAGMIEEGKPQRELKEVEHVHKYFLHQDGFHYCSCGRKLPE